MSHPFDALAPTYDADFTHTATARFLRARVQARLAQLFAAGQHVLELGCGTGEDAAFLGARGVRVTATDASSAMLAIARAKTAALPNVAVGLLDLNALPDDTARYDGAFANFGVLNCVREVDALAAWLAARLPRDGMAAFVVMSPLCVWEMAWYALHLDCETATRRWRVSSFQPTPDSAPITITCPRPRALARTFAPHFRVVQLAPLGLFLPPTALYAAVEKRPRLHKLLLQWEAKAAHARAFAALADHYWIVFARN